MFDKNFFNRNDISTVRNNYLLMQTRLRYNHYYDYLSGIDRSDPHFIPKFNKQYLKNAILVRNVMDEHPLTQDIIANIYCFASEYADDYVDEYIGYENMEGVEREQVKIMLLSYVMKELEEDYLNDDLDEEIDNYQILNSKFKEHMINLDNINLEETDYHIIKNRIYNCVKKHLEKVVIEIWNFRSYKNQGYICIKDDMLDDMAEALTIDVICCFYSLLLKEEKNNISSFIDAILPNDNISRENLRKKYNHFTKEGIFKLFKDKYICEKGNNNLSVAFDADFLYHLISGDFEVMESCASRDQMLEKSVKKKISKFNEIGKKDPILQYHIEQHFMIYSLYYMNKRLEKTQNMIQVTSECSLLYDIPFPLLRIMIAKARYYNTKQTPSADKTLSLVKFKYYVYNLLKFIVEALFKKSENLNVGLIEANIYLNDYSLKDDISNFMSRKKTFEYSEFIKDILCVLAYNEEGKKIQRTVEDFDKDFKEFLKKNHMQF